MTSQSLTEPLPPAVPNSREARDQVTSELLRQAAEADDEDQRRCLLQQVVVLNMAVANAAVSRFRGRGVATDDLRQVAYMALVKAARGFDAARVLEGGNFVTFAIPTIRGELRKYFRDHAWMVRPTRRIQELQPRLAAANEELWHSLGRSPTPTEVAEHIGEPVEAVLEALSTDGCFQPSSLDRPVNGDDEDSASLGQLIAAEDPGQDTAEARVMLQPAIRQLSERDRRILQLRFFRGMTQREISEDIGVTQMQVSRLLSRIYRDLRQFMGEST